MAARGRRWLEDVFLDFHEAPRRAQDGLKISQLAPKMALKTEHAPRFSGLCCLMERIFSTGRHEMVDDVDKMAGSEFTAVVRWPKLAHDGVKMG